MSNELEALLEDAEKDMTVEDLLADAEADMVQEEPTQQEDRPWYSVTPEGFAKAAEAQIAGAVSMVPFSDVTQSAVSAVKAGYKSLTDEEDPRGFSEYYDESKKQYRDYQERLAEELPAAHMSGQVLGAASTMIGPAGSVVQKAGSAIAPKLPKVGEAAVAASEAGINTFARTEDPKEALDAMYLAGGITIAPSALTESLGKIKKNTKDPVEAAKFAIRSLGDAGEHLLATDPDQAIRLGRRMLDDQTITKGKWDKLAKIKQDKKRINEALERSIKNLTDNGATIRKTEYASKLQQKADEFEGIAPVKRLIDQRIKDENLLKKDITKEVDGLDKNIKRLKERIEELKVGSVKSTTTKRTSSSTSKVNSEVEKVLDDEIKKATEKLEDLKVGSTKITSTKRTSDTQGVRRSKTETTTDIRDKYDLLKQRLQDLKDQKTRLVTSKASRTGSGEVITSSESITDISEKAELLQSRLDDLMKQRTDLVNSVDTALDDSLTLQQIRERRMFVDEEAFANKLSANPAKAKEAGVLREIEDELASKTESRLIDEGKILPEGTVKDIKGEYSDVATLEKVVTKGNNDVGQTAMESIAESSKPSLSAKYTAGTAIKGLFDYNKRRKLVNEALRLNPKSSLATDPKWKDIFNEAIERSGNAGIAATHMKLMQTDREYRERYNKEKGKEK